MFQDKTERVLPEAAWVAFTDVVIDGHRWSITLREGMDDGGVDQMLATVQYAAEKLRGIVDDTSTPPTPSRPTYTEQNGARASVQNGNGQQVAPGGGVWKIARLLVVKKAGEEQTRIEMWDANTKLQFPQTTVPSAIVIGHLLRRYGEDTFDEHSLERLRTRDEDMRVTWDVHWVPSSKNPKYKDIGAIIIPRQEKQRGTA